MRDDVDRATRMIEKLTDVDGSQADGTLPFSYDGSDYETELNKRNRGASDKATAPDIAAARKVRASDSGALTRHAAT